MLIKTVPGKCELSLHALTDSVNTGQSNLKGGGDQPKQYTITNSFNKKTITNIIQTTVKLAMNSTNLKNHSSEDDYHG